MLGTDATVEAVAGSVAKALTELHVAEAHADVHEQCHPGRLVVVTGAKSGEERIVDRREPRHRARRRRQPVGRADRRRPAVRRRRSMLGLPPAPLDDSAAAADVDADRQSMLSMLTPHAPTQLGVLIPPRTTVPIDDSVKQQTVAVISGVQALADVVVLDAPFHLVEAADLLAYADEVVFVTDADLASIKNTMVGARRPRPRRRPARPDPAGPQQGGPEGQARPRRHRAPRRLEGRRDPACVAPPWRRRSTPACRCS